MELEAAMKLEKPFELPSPSKISERLKEQVDKVWSSLFAEKRRTKEKAKSLSSVITPLTVQEGVKDFGIEEIRRHFLDLEATLNSLAREKPNFTKRVFREVLPKTFGKRTWFAREFTNLLQEQPLPRRQSEEKVSAMLERSGFSDEQKKLVFGLANLFAQIGEAEGPAQPPKEEMTEEKWDRIVGREPEPPEKRRKREEESLKQSKEEVERRTREATKSAFFTRQIRRQAAVPLLLTAALLSLWAYTEKDQQIEYSPVSHLLEKPLIRDIPIIGRQPVAERFYYGPEAQKAVENRPEFNIDNWLIDVYFQPANRKNAEDPSKYDKKAKSYISALDKKFKGVDADEIAQTAMTSPFYKDHPEFAISWKVAQEIIQAKRTGEKIDPEIIKDFREIIWEGKLANILPPWED